MTLRLQMVQASVAVSVIDAQTYVRPSAMGHSPRLHPTEGHRVVEIGAVELVNRSLAGETFHCYLCPQRAMPADALAVHGLTAEFLADKPLFGDVADELLAFVGDAPLVARNAGFDIAFLNAELKHAVKPTIATERRVSGGKSAMYNGLKVASNRLKS